MFLLSTYTSQNANCHRGEKSWRGNVCVTSTTCVSHLNAKILTAAEPQPRFSTVHTTALSATTTIASSSFIMAVKASDVLLIIVCNAVELIVDGN